MPSVLFTSTLGTQQCYVSNCAKVISVAFTLFGNNIV